MLIFHNLDMIALHHWDYYDRRKITHDPNQDPSVNHRTSEPEGLFPSHMATDDDNLIDPINEN